MSFNYKMILKVLGLVALIIGCALLFPAFISFYYNETHLVKSFLLTAIPSIFAGSTILYFNKSDRTRLTIRDGYLIVAVSWLFASFIGAIPYMISHTAPNFIDAFFESASGFTTTGVSVLSDVSTLPKGLLFWRSFSHWLGAMGILVYAISILPALRIGGQRIAKSETPGPTMETISTRMSDSAKRLYIMYMILTIIAAFLLKLGGLSFFDTIIHAFGSMGTGGLSIYTNGVASSDSLYIEAIVTIFSLLASINFVLYSYLLRGHFKVFFADAELRIFLGILAVFALLITLNLWMTDTYSSFGSSLIHSLLQTAAFMSTTDYITSNYSLWPTFSQVLLFVMLFIGGCSASTSGSIKVIRIIVLFKLIVRGTLKRLHPIAVVPVKITGKTVHADRISSITNFILLYFTVFIVTAIVISLDNYDLVTSLSASAAALSNTGMGMGMVGSSGSFEIFSPFVRLWLSFVMIAGRLEIFTILLLFTPSFWNPAKRIKI